MIRDSKLRTIIPFGGASVISALSGIVLLLVLTRMLSPAAFGQFTVLTSLCAIAQATLFFWIQHGALRLGAEPDHLAAPGALARAVRMASAAAMLVTAGGAALLSLTPALDDISVAAGVTAFLYLLTRAQTGIVQGRNRLNHALPRYLLSELAIGGGTVVLAVAALLVWPGQVAAPLGAGAAAALIVILANPAAKAAVGAPVPLAALFRYGAPVAVVALADTLLRVSDRWIIAHYAGDAAAGAYAAGYAVADRGIMVALGAIASTTRVSVFVAHDGGAPDDARGILNEYAILLLAVGLPAATLLGFGAGPAARFVIGGEMAGPAATVLPWLGPATLLAAILSTYFGMAFQIARRPALMLVALAPAAVANIVANLILVPVYGAVAAAWTTLGGYVLALLIAAPLAQRQFRLPVPVGAGFRLVLACVPLALIARWPGAEAAVGPFATLLLAGLAYVAGVALLFPEFVPRLGRHS